MSSFWNALTGKPRTPPPASADHNSTDAPPDSGDSAPTTSFLTYPPSPSPSPLAPFDQATATNVPAFLSAAATGSDPSALHPLAGLGGGLTYLDVDEAALSSIPGGQSVLPSRGWSDDLCYGTGTTYLVALTLGGAWGLSEGLAKLQPHTPPRLKLNTVLNGITRRGPFLGNSAGVLALAYNAINSTVGHYRGKHDTANSIISGALAGALFKSTRGPRPMAVSAAIVGAAAAAWSVGSKALL